LAVDDAGQGFQQGGMFIAKMIGQVADIARMHGAGGHAHDLGEGAVDLVTHVLAFSAEVLDTPFAAVASPAGNCRAKRDTVTGGETRMPRRLDHLAGEFMAQNRWITDPGGFAAAEDPDVGPADRGGAHAHQHVVDFGLGRVDVLNDELVWSDEFSSLHYRILK
jgi:hypothetical protein